MPAEAATSSPSVSDLQQRIEMLEAELRARTAERDEILAVNAKVLRVINASPGDLNPVFDTILEQAMRLCEAAFGIFMRYEGELVHPLAYRGLGGDMVAGLTRSFRPHPGGPMAQALSSRGVVQLADLRDSDAYRSGAPGGKLADVAGARSVAWVPLHNDGGSQGLMVLFRCEVRPFTGKQVTLLQTFADQAVIAMENARLLNEQREALAQQTATAEVLQVINASPGDLVPVFDSMLDKAMRLCRASFGIFRIYDGSRFHGAASHGVPPAYADFLARNPQQPQPGSLGARIVAGEAQVHVIDLAEDKAQLADPHRRALVELGGARTTLVVALTKDRNLLGAVQLYRQHVQAFSDRQIALLENFAAQAVIAMENARLLSELRDRQAELRATFDNMGDGVVMFDANLRLAACNRNFQELLDVPDSFLASRPGLEDYVRLLVTRGELGPRNPDEEAARYRERATHQWSAERTRPDGRIIGVRNNPVPGGGAVMIYGDITERKKAEAEIAAARDAAEVALERQTATADILKVIASSPNDVQPVFDVVVKAAVRLCGAQDSLVVMRDGSEVVFAAHEGPLGGNRGDRWPLVGDNTMGGAIIQRRTIHVPDVSALRPGEFTGTQRGPAVYGFRAIVAAPLMREGSAIGALLLRRRDAGAFTPQQIELLETFAAQAVIAIENVRLFTELRDALEQQTATGEILRAISQSPTDVQPVLTAVAKAALRFCGAADAAVSLREGESWVAAAHEGTIGHVDGRRTPIDRQHAVGRAIIDGITCHLPHVASLDPVEWGSVRRMAAEYGFGTVVAAPLLRDGIAIGAVALRKIDPSPFTPPQISMLETFAAQAVIAIQNVRLFTELRDSLERLKAAQANLIQSEKMASLGQLAAGIAHEIKNPLNFVNNFAGLSAELLEDLSQAVTALLADPDDDKRGELQDTMDLLTGNLARIVDHGRRADGIVKSMLAHSRGGTGDWQTSNINGLVEEALNLAYHGARAQDQSFNVALERDFGEALKPIDVVPQDITRVFLNLFGNSFYAVRKRRREGGADDYSPALRVSTRDRGEAIEVRVRDNGTGIVPELRDRLFQPFFTTKPTGEGTGLGLSISYDIVTQQHGGTIEVDSEPGQFTEFAVRLPRARRAPAQAGGSS